MSDCPGRLFAGMCSHNCNLICAQTGFCFSAAVTLQHGALFIFTLHKMIDLISCLLSVRAGGDESELFQTLCMNVCVGGFSSPHCLLPAAEAYSSLHIDMRHIAVNFSTLCHHCRKITVCFAITSLCG